MVVIGFGHPFDNLFDKEDTFKREAAVLREHQELKERMKKPAIDAWQKKQLLMAAESEKDELMLEIKMERDSDKRNLLQAELDIIKGQIINANYEFTWILDR